MSDAWAEATYHGKQRGQQRRTAALTAEERLAWLENELRSAQRSGLLARIRERRQQETLRAWTQKRP